jgi:hypothetical protein
VRARFALWQRVSTTVQLLGGAAAMFCESTAWLGWQFLLGCLRARLRGWAGEAVVLLWGFDREFETWGTGPPWIHGKRDTVADHLRQNQILNRPVNESMVATLLFEARIHGGYAH